MSEEAAKLSPELQRMYEVMARKEDLLPELRPYLNDKNTRMPVLQHPLVYGVPYTPGMNAMYNEQYKAKVKYLEEARQEKKWVSYIFLYERPYRFHAFREIKEDLTDDEYWKLLGDIWTDSENIWQYRVLVEYFFMSDRPGRENMMDENERQFLAELPDEFIIYRGHGKKNKMGWSWTLSYGMAAWFSNRFSREPARVVSAICRKEDVMAAFLGRNEFEIVVDPNKLKNVKSIRKLSRTEGFEVALQHARSQHILRGKTYHGPLHWEKVERNALALAKADKRIDKTVVRLFAILHDCKRTNEDHDPEHGIRAAQFIRELYADGQLPITEKQLEKLVYATEKHNDGTISDDPTIGACWDADRLDLPRVGVAPDPALLSTKAAKEMVWKI